MPRPYFSTRVHRRWLAVLISSLVGAMFILALVFTPSFQSWALKRFVQRQSAWTLDFENFSARPRQLSARGLVFTMPGIRLKTEPVSIQLAPGKLITERQIRIQSVGVSRIDLAITPAELRPSKEPFSGLLHLLQLPLAWELDKINLGGNVELLDQGKPWLGGNYLLSGGGLSPDQAGEFAYTFTGHSSVLSGSEKAPFMTTGTVQVEPNHHHGIARITIAGDIALPPHKGTALPPGKVWLEITTDSSGEHYRARASFGDSANIEARATLDPIKHRVSGHLQFRGNQEIVRPLSPLLPQFVADGSIDFAYNLEGGDSLTTLAIDAEARDWKKVALPLAEIGTLKAHLVATVAQKGLDLILNDLKTNICEEATGALVTLSTRQPIPIQKIPSEPMANLSLEHIPLVWTNPFIKDQGFQFSPSSVDGSWSLTVVDGHTVRATAKTPVTFGSIALLGNPWSLPPLTLDFRSQIELAASRVSVAIEDLHLNSSAGDAVTGGFKVSKNLITGAIDSKGNLQSDLPTLFGIKGTPPPFALSARWEVVSPKDRLQIYSLSIKAFRPETNTELAAFESTEPIDLDLKQYSDLSVLPNPGSLSTTVHSDSWAHLRLRDFPLSWLSRFSSGSSITGTVTAGETSFATDAAHTTKIVSVVPWSLHSVYFAHLQKSAKKRLDIRFAPEVNIAGSHIIGKIRDFALSDEAGNQATGEVAITIDTAAKTFSSKIAVEGDLARISSGKDSLGALHVSFRSAFHNVNQSIVAADSLNLSLSNKSGELASLSAPQPFIFGLSHSGAVVASTAEPVRLRVGRIPFAWLRSGTPSLEMSGDLEPAEFLIGARINQYTLRSVAPVQLAHLSLRRDAQQVLDNATVEFKPAIDISFLSATKPKFEMAYVGTVGSGPVSIVLGDQTRSNFEAVIGFKGNQTTTLFDTIDFQSRFDLASFGPGLGLPAKGQLQLTAKGDLLGTHPSELKLKLSGLTASDTTSVLPPFTIDLVGNLSPELVLSGHVALLLDALPTPTDVAFDASLNLTEGGLNITSLLKSHYIDGTALLNLEHAFKHKLPAGKVAVTDSKKLKSNETAVPTRTGTLPFWGELRGSFGLTLGAVQFAPYQINGISGRIDADQSHLNLHDLTGEMFAGRWSGNLQIEHSPNDTTGEHRMNGAFNITQFDSARVMQSVFPNQLASVDSQINVHSNVSSHGNSFGELIDRSAADFTIDGEHGMIRLTVPKADAVSTAAVFGGTVLLSPELRALGRLLKKFSQMPLEQLTIKGQRTESGEVLLNEFAFDSPQLKMRGQGRIPSEPAEPLMTRPLDLSLDLSAKEDLAVILGGMRLLDTAATDDGYRKLREPIKLGGRAGSPDTTPLYNLFARAVSGSKGTWGLLMRKLQAELKKKQAHPNS